MFGQAINSMIRFDGSSKYAMASTMISLLREIVVGVGFALLLPQFFALDGVLYSFPAADLLTFEVAVGVIVFTYRELRVVEE